MRLKQIVMPLGVAAFVGAVGACSDSTSPSASTAFNQTVSAELAPTAGEDISADFHFYVNASSTSSGTSFALKSGVAGGIPNAAAAIRSWLSPNCTYNNATGYFECPPLTFLHHTFTARYQLLDGSGAAQSAYDTATTASIHFITSDTGAVSWTFNSSAFADTSSRHHDATVSNLAGHPDTTHIWNGTGSGSIHSVRTGQITKDFSITFSDTTTAVTVRLPRSINPYPLSGTIVKNYSIIRTRAASDTTTRSATRRVVVTFNGTATVPLTINGVEYELNLDTHRVTKKS